MIEEIPKSYRYVCDNCGAVHIQENAGGHYTNSHPPTWGWLRIQRHALDYQNVPAADGSIARLLCDTCLTGLCDKINRLMEELKVVNRAL